MTAADQIKGIRIGSEIRVNGRLAKLKDRNLNGHIVAERLGEGAGQIDFIPRSATTVEITRAR